MRALDIDFLPRRLSRLGIACLALGILAAVAVGADYRNAARRTSLWQEQLDRLQQPARRRPPPRAGDDRELQQMAQAAQAVAQDIRRPWPELFAALEKAKSDDVALLSLNPDTGRGAVRITGEARQREAVFAFIERLGQEPALRNVMLLEDQIQQDSPERPVRFLIAADWAGAAP